LYEKQAAVAKKYKLALVAYEGGQHLVAEGPMMNDRELNNLLDKAVSDPRMKEIYLANLAHWKAKGGTLFVHYLNCMVKDPPGRYGALDFLEQPGSDAPRFDALQEFIEKNPR